MSAAKFTPGPWVMARYGAISGGPEFQFANGSAQKQIAMACVVPEGVEGDQLANARLIAAAPTLLKALQDLELGANTVAGCYARNPGNFAAALRDLQEYAEKARDAIAAATSQQPDPTR